MFYLHEPWAGKASAGAGPAGCFHPKGSGRGSAVRLSGKGTRIAQELGYGYAAELGSKRNIMPGLAMLPPDWCGIRLPGNSSRRILWRFACGGSGPMRGTIVYAWEFGI